MDRVHVSWVPHTVTAAVVCFTFIIDLIELTEKNTGRQCHAHAVSIGHLPTCTRELQWLMIGIASQTLSSLCSLNKFLSR